MACLGILLVSCGKGKESALAGDPYTFHSEIPDDSDDLDFMWELTEKPDDSEIINSDFSLDETGAHMTFVPDVSGGYAVEVSVFQYNDEISTQSFSVTVEDPEADFEEDIDSEEFIAEGEDEVNDWDAVAELIGEDETADEEESIKWYEEENTDFDLEEEEPIIVPSAAMETPESPPSPTPEKKQKPKISPGSSIPFDQNRFTIQVASKKNLDQAKIVAAILIEAGYDAYIQKALFKENGAVWYRIRVGSYENKDTALAVAKTISEFQKEMAWVDFVRYEN